jgi:glycosyltransferase involved in cell wall biosynthesis
MNVLLWHVHGSWTTAFVQGRHRYLLPVLPGRGPDGLGRADSWDWPPSAIEVAPAAAPSLPVDVVVMQRPDELRHLVRDWLGGREPGRDVPAVYLEHSTPQGPVNAMRHVAADRPDLTVVHVTHFNRLFWDTGRTPTRVIEHGMIDPGYRYTGELDRGAVVVNEPARRGRVVGADLLPELGRAMPLDLFGIGTERSLPQSRLHDEMARRRAYVHPYRWTSLGLSLVEAMHLGMPVVALATTEAPEAVPAAAGIVTNRLDRLTEGLRRLAAEPARARRMGEAARRYALERYGLARFLSEWDQLLQEAAAA